jgi:hypothetical protein
MSGYVIHATVGEELIEFRGRKKDGMDLGGFGEKVFVREVEGLDERVSGPEGLGLHRKVVVEVEPFWEEGILDSGVSVTDGVAGEEAHGFVDLFRDFIGDGGENVITDVIENVVHKDLVREGVVQLVGRSSGWLTKRLMRGWTGIIFRIDQRSKSDGVISNMVSKIFSLSKKTINSPDSQTSLRTC